jgi:hypothetical protein
VVCLTRIYANSSAALPYDEQKKFETCRRQEELNQKINLKIAFCCQRYRIVSQWTVQKKLRINIFKNTKLLNVYNLTGPTSENTLIVAVKTIT